MTIKELKQVIDKAYKKCKDGKVEIYIEVENELVDGIIDNISQYGVYPAMTMTIKPKSEIMLITKKLTAKRFNFKKERDNALKKLDKIEEILRED